METENQNPFQLDVINLLAFNPFHNFPSLPTSRLYVRGTILGYKSFAGGMRVYICEHNTSPPESQHIETDQQNILIRSLMLNNNKGGSSSKDVKAAAEGPRKRH
ncbi:hypothetical protein E1A91_D01G105800v1 [Gossypium mustelinum]|uniref:DET1- and DDB1-associated protein 1 domain-containing protein n=1 Tax=Gossypium mustelinum TaxID=34275 RepID=A0A5D2W516_GOSMU|nr:hypothetical protein E1A91_D01G105800v1 [Gossypium mustelinum]